MEDELLVLLKDRLGIGARRIDPEFKHAAGAGESAGNFAIALDLAGVADIDDHDVVALRGLDGIRRADGLDLRVRLVDQGFDTAMDGLGHFLSLWFFLASNDGGRIYSNVPVPSSHLRDLR